MELRSKYPRTAHLPWSPGATPDDLRLADPSGFLDREVVVTEKLDGENTTIYTDGSSHARSLDSVAHPSRTRLKALAARLIGAIPPGTRICGENLYARHSLGYDDLLGYFYGFSVWTGERCWSWDATEALLGELGIPTPRVLYRGLYDKRAIRGLKVPAHRQEGYVVRWADGFDRSDFGRAVAKWVRPSHVRTDAHWMNQAVVPNGLAPEAVLWDVRSGDRPDAARLDAYFGDERSLLELPLPERGERRLALVLAGRFAEAPRSTLLPRLFGSLGRVGRSTADLVGLARRLHVPMPDDRRHGGLVSLGRAVDLTGLHALAEALAPDDAAREQVQWSRLVAEDLLDDPLHVGWLDALDLPEDPVSRAWLAGRALQARARGTLRHPAEARAWLHPLRGERPAELTILVGPSGTGKSTAAPNYPGVVIGLDALRDEGVDQVLDRALATLRETLRGGRSAVWDATSLTPTQRALPLGIARPGRTLTRLVSVLTPRSRAEARNRARKRTVPTEVVERQWRRVRWPYGWEADELVDLNDAAG